MKTQENPSYAEACEVVSMMFGKPEATSDGARTWTFTPKMKSPPWPLWCSELPADIQVLLFREMVLARLRAAGFMEVT